MFFFLLLGPDVIQDVVPQSVIEEEEKSTKRKCSFTSASQDISKLMKM